MMGPAQREFLQLVDEYGLTDRLPWIPGVCQLIARGDLDEATARALTLSLQGALAEQERKPNYLFRPPAHQEMYPKGPPDVVLGQLVESQDTPLGLFLKGPVFCILVGAPGGGKTTAMRVLIERIHALNAARHKPISMIVIDRKGGDYADLPARLGAPWVHYHVGHGLRLGLNAPPGVPENEWINHVSTMYCAREGLIAAWTTLANAIRWLLGQLNRHPGGTTIWPDFRLILDVVRGNAHQFASKLDYQRSLIQSLEGVVKGSGELFCASQGLVLTEVVNEGKSAVIAAPVVSPPRLRQFIGDLLVSQVLLDRIHRGHRVDHLEVLFVIDEVDADVSFRAEQAFPDGMPPISQLARFGREFGLGACLGLGSLSSVSRHMLAAANYHLLFKLTNSYCVAEAVRTLLLPARAAGLFPALEPGECVFRQTRDWAHAVLGRVDFVPPSREAHPAYDTPPFQPPARPGQPLREGSDSSTPPLVPVTDSAQVSVLSSLSRQFLFLESIEPYAPAARLYEKMNSVPPPAAQMVVLSELKSASLSKFEETRIGKRNVLIPEMTDAGWALVGKPPKALGGGGSIAHRAFIDWIARVGALRGRNVKRECPVPGTTHRADVAWEFNGSWEVFEVVVKSVGNVLQHLDAILVHAAVPIVRVTLVRHQLKLLNELRTIVEGWDGYSHHADRIRFSTIEPFEREIWK